MIVYNHNIKVYYKDIDKMGIVYYSRYFEYFEEARTELLKSIGLEVSNIENEGIHLPVIESHCEYKKGATFEEQLIIKTSISKIPRSKLKIKYKVFSKGYNDLCVKGYTVHAFINKNGKPTKPPFNIIAIFKDKGIEP